MAFYSWGQNGQGQTAKGTVTAGSPGEDFPQSLSDVPSTATVYGGTQNSAPAGSVAIDSDGSVWVWGDNNVIPLNFPFTARSRFGNQFTAGTAVPTATKLTYANAVNATSAAVDFFATYWLKSDNTLWAVGLDSEGAFGIGNTSDTVYATPVQIASSVASFGVGMGGSATANFYIDLSGNLYFTGINTYGLTGNGGTTPATVTTWQQVTAITGAQKVWTNGNSVFCQTGASTLKCWGYNFDGELGLGNTTVQHSPQTITSLPSGVAISDVFVSIAEFTYVLLADGRLYVTGWNGGGALGLGNNTNNNSFVQSTVGSSLSVSALARGSGCWTGAVIAGGKYWAAGSNDNGQVDASLVVGAYNAFTNALTFTGPVAAIAFVGDDAVFVQTTTGRARSWSFVLG